MQIQNDITDVLDVICPMHLVLNSSGHVVHSGPTLAKLWQGKKTNGKRFFEEFEVLRPREVDGMVGLLAARGQKLHLRKHYWLTKTDFLTFLAPPKPTKAKTRF